jgi:UDP-N-acetylmuramoylalanine--D-glutamate ligase
MDEWQGKRVSVVGLGRSGMAACRLLVRLGAIPFASELRPEEELDSLEVEHLRSLGIGLEFGGHSERVLEADWLVVSPGIPRHAPIIKQALERGLPVMGEIEFASRLIQGPMVAVTGTNGKTTTASLIEFILRSSDKHVSLGGNICPGSPLSDLVPSPEDRVVIVEVSTFQLEWVDRFHAHIAVLTNIAPDHLDRHGSMEAYAALKGRVFINQTPQDISVLNGDDPWVMRVGGRSQAQRMLFSRTKEVVWGAFIRGNEVVYRREREEVQVISAEEINLRGSHNIENCLAAVAVGVALGAEISAIRRSLAEFRGVEHREEVVGAVGDVVFVNNSMCTNPTACARSVAAFSPNLVAIVGGKGKGGVEWEVMVKELLRAARHVILLGETAADLERLLHQQGYRALTRVDSMQRAVETAYGVAISGDVVLLAPGFASFDMFDDFRQRGESFREAVRELQKRCRAG